MKLRWILLIVLILLVLFLTFVYRKAKNPLTNVYINYIDDKSPSDKQKLCHDIMKNILPIHYNDIFIIKTKQSINTDNIKSRLLKIFVFKLSKNYNCCVIMSSRFKVTKIVPINNSHTLCVSISDNIINVPYISSLYSYHSLNLILDSTHLGDNEYINDNNYTKKCNHFNKFPAAALIISAHSETLHTNKEIKIIDKHEKKLYNAYGERYILEFEKFLKF